MSSQYVSYVVMDEDERRLMTNAPRESTVDNLAHVCDFIMNANIEKVKEDNKNIDLPIR